MAPVLDGVIQNQFQGGWCWFGWEQNHGSAFSALPRPPRKRDRECDGDCKLNHDQDQIVDFFRPNFRTYHREQGGVLIDFIVHRFKIGHPNIIRYPLRSERDEKQRFLLFTHHTARRIAHRLSFSLWELWVKFLSYLSLEFWLKCGRTEIYVRLVLLRYELLVLERCIFGLPLHHQQGSVSLFCTSGCSVVVTEPNDCQVHEE